MAVRRQQKIRSVIRPPMRSPGRPPVSRREHRHRFWSEIAAVGAEDYRVLIKQSPVACASIREALMEQGYPSAALALRSAEHTLNRSLYASRVAD